MHVGVLYSSASATSDEFLPCTRAGLLDALDTDRLITAPQLAPGRIETGTLNHAAIAGVGAQDGISVWSGNFYAKRVIEVLGLAEQGGIVRCGFFVYNAEEEVDRLLEALQRVASSPVTVDR